MKNPLRVDEMINPHVSVDCVVLGSDGEHLKVLLVKQTGHEESGYYNNMKLPGSLIYNDEDLDEAAQRVLYELTGLNELHLIQFRAFGSKNRTNNPKDIKWLERFHQLNQKVERIVTITYQETYPFVRPLRSLLDGHRCALPFGFRPQPDYRRSPMVRAAIRADAARCPVRPSPQEIHRSRTPHTLRNDI